jgi:SAM-dependent methyltransferase
LGGKQDVHPVILDQPLFDQLVDEAWHHEFSGWDFAYVSRRLIESQPSWDYRQLILEKIHQAKALLDMDTGGGEFLSSLRPLPTLSCATEGYPPNVPIAKARLEALGVQVIDTSATVDLPFRDNSFDLVINRHGDFLAAEVHRLLKPGGRFVTQQVGGRNCIQLNEVLQDPVEVGYAGSTLESAVRTLEECGLRILDQREEYPRAEFRDIGAVVFYLKAVPWQIRDFSLEKYYARLGKIHNLIQATGRLVVTEHRFYIEAQKSAAGPSP